MIGMERRERVASPQRRLGVSPGCTLLLVLSTLSVASSFSMSPRLSQTRGGHSMQMRLRLPKQSKFLLLSVLPNLLQRVQSVVGYRVRVPKRGGRRRMATALPADAPLSGASSLSPHANGALPLSPDAADPPPEGPGSVPILIRYSGGEGYKSLYAGCVKVLRETFPNVSIKKVILGNMQGGSRNKGTFEVIVGDQVYSKRGAFGVYLPMQDLQVALDNMMKTKKEGAVPAPVWGKFLDDDGNLKPE